MWTINNQWTVAPHFEPRSMNNQTQVKMGVAMSTLKKYPLWYHGNRGGSCSNGTKPSHFQFCLWPNVLRDP